MTEFRPTHKTKPGVEVQACPDGYWQRVCVRNTESAMLCSSVEFAALFEPIVGPQPMVHIPLAVAKSLTVSWYHPSSGGLAVQTVRDAIALAEKENPE